jgi:hypothetical protein
MSAGKVEEPSGSMERAMDTAERTATEWIDAQEAAN